jgi:hypothetical protein
MTTDDGFLLFFLALVVLAFRHAGDKKAKEIDEKRANDARMLAQYKRPLDHRLGRDDLHLPLTFFQEESERQWAEFWAAVMHVSELRLARARLADLLEQNPPVAVRQVIQIRGKVVHDLIRRYEAGERLTPAYADVEMNSAEYAKLPYWPSATG